MTPTRLAPCLCILLLAAALPAAGAEQQASYQIVQRKVAPRAPTLVVHQGDSVRINFTCDEAARLHLHGYDVLLALQPGRTGQMRVQADALGRFPVAAHGFGSGHQHEVTLIYLEVQPK
ncbi:MAG: hypothetical protein V4508_21565 [Pseudomonadota bacterium]